MEKQLYYSKTHSKNIEIYLSKLYAKTSRLLIVLANGGLITNYVMCASSCFCVTKAQVHRHLLS